ncbi:MAG: ABC transporter ATP-binding protein [Clostridia bacterium]|nr:ABC transporter ATP-binding protein [Clostridia bacterium]
MALEVRDLNWTYDDRPILKNVTFSAVGGELLSILGPNGVGKSTLFRCLLGLHRSYTGSIKVDGREASELSAKDLAKHIAYIPQIHYPVFHYTVYEIVLMGTTHQVSMFSAPGKIQKEAAELALEQMGVTHLAPRDFNCLSGGERQLCLIARAIAQKTSVLLLDEPCASLDFGNQLHVLTRLRALTEQGLTVVQTTHNPEQSYRFSHRVLALLGGGVLALGTPGEVICSDVMSQLYSVPLDVQSINRDTLRICVSKENCEEQIC